MRFIFASDSYKGTLSAVKITELLKQAALKHFPQAETLALPVADGGEGTVDAVVAAAGGRKVTVNVTGPLGEAIKAEYGLLDDGVTAVIEMAQASGLPLVPESLRDPRNTTTYGTGELIRYALEAGAKRLLIGIGGSATNDGGMGMLMALGAVFTDKQGQQLKPVGASLARVANVDLSHLVPIPSGEAMTVICDVVNPLLGEHGAVYTYGKQKGATPEISEELERGMRNYAAVIQKAAGRDIANFPGAGAAGGLGAALGGVLGAAMRSGVDAVLDTAGFDELLAGTDLVITGEGRLDGQSVRYGKVPAGVARRCQAKGVPVIAIVGGMGENAEDFLKLAESSIQVTVNDCMSLATALENSEAHYRSAADRLFRTLKIGWQMNPSSLFPTR